MSEQLECGLCGRTGHDVLWQRLVEWTEDERRRAVKPTWDAVNRCADYQACRIRVEGRGQRWPVRDSITTGTITLVDEPEEARL